MNIYTGRFSEVEFKRGDAAVTVKAKDVVLDLTKLSDRQLDSLLDILEKEQKFRKPEVANGR